MIVLKKDDNRFDIEDEFVVGYGIDYTKKYGNLYYIEALK